MSRDSRFGWVQRRLADLSIAQKLALIIGIPICVTLLILALAVGGFYALSGIRAYVGGEGLYSKSQKNAVIHLDAYARTGDPREYQQFERYLAVPLGDQAARRELEKPQYDYATVARAFEQGGNNPADIPIMIIMFRWGRGHISHIDRAIAIWTQGDVKINALRRIAADLNREIASGRPARTRVNQLLGQTNVLNNALTRLEGKFSFTLAETARWLNLLLLEIMLLAMPLFLALCIGLARAIAKELIGEIDQLKRATVRATHGDFSEPIVIESHDEIGQLGILFNEMATQREKAQSALEQEDEFLNVVLENISDGVVACDEHGVLTLFNHATREFHGLPAQPLPPEQWSEHYDLYLADGKAPMQTEQIPLLRALKGEVIRDVEIVIAPKGGPRRTVRCDGQSLTTPSGKNLGAVLVMHDITESKRTAEEDFETLLEASPNAMVAVDDHGRITIVNSQAESLFGYQRAEMLDEPIEKLIPERLRNQHMLLRYDYSNEPTARQMGVGLELFGLCKDGREVAIEIGLNPIRTPHGMLVLAAIVDITERKRAEAARDEIRRMLEYHRGFEEAQKIAHIGSWEWDAASDTIVWSDELYRIYGTSPKSFEPTYDAYLQRMHDDDRNAIDAAVRKALKAREPLDFEQRIIHPDGTIRTVHVRGRPIVNNDGKLIRVSGSGHDVTERKQAELQLLQLAHFDSLTGLPNRAMFIASLRDVIAQAAEQQWIVAVMFMDIDHFKDINDTLGHAHGDELLRQIGRRLMHSLRVRDTVGRMGGDEFTLVLISEQNLHSVEIVANKLRDTLRQPFDLEGREVLITTSIGISMFPADSTDPETLLNYADTAMYAAKEAGRDAQRFYTTEMNVKVAQRLDLEKSLRLALKHDEFVLHYQPKIDLASGRWAGVEALLRWNRPGHGLVLPGEFVPALEDTGLIEPVGIWVIDAACLQIAAWIAAGIGAIPIAVNVSVKQLLHGRNSQTAYEVAQGIPSVAALVESSSLERAVERTLRRHNVATNLLEFELTESTLMLHALKPLGLLQRLKSLGIAISIAHFGTGYSSLAQLKRLPIDALKIDQIFIKDMNTDARSAPITISSIALAHNLKLRVVAEGVETREQLDFLCAHGCDEAQGYYIARPMSADAVAELFRTSSGPLSI